MRKQQVKSLMQKFTVKDFRKQFPNDDVCLEWLKDFIYPDGIPCIKCDKITKHHKVASRKSYSCDRCGHHVHPTAGTIYHKSSTPLTDWFYAVFLMASTRCGISAKQLERELGVTYKTAWRMFHQIRSMLTESDDKLGGEGSMVEVDETYIGARRKGITGRGAKDKTIIVGAVERKGSVKAKIVPNTKAESLVPFVRETVEQLSIVHTDEWRPYRHLLNHRYYHETSNHGHKQWVVGESHTNSIEGFWSLLKGGLRGVYKGRATRKYLQNYINEYAFRYNRRHDQTPMFLSFLFQTTQSVD